MTREELLHIVPEESKKSEMYEILKNVPNQILMEFNVCTGHEDTVLQYTGDEFKYLYILLSGHIKLSYELNTEFTYSYAVIPAVNILGETEAFAEYPYYKTTLSCADECKYLILSKALFRTWMQEDPKALWYIASSVSKKYSDQVRQDRTYLSASGEDRFIYLLSKYYNNTAKDKTCIITTPKEFLAEEICVSNKTISRSISKLKSSGLISVNGHNIVIDDSQYNEIHSRYSYLFNIDF